MSWLCPSCSSENNGALTRCYCGYEIDLNADEKRKEFEAMSSQKLIELYEQEKSLPLENKSLALIEAVLVARGEADKIPGASSGALEEAENADQSTADPNSTTSASKKADNPGVTEIVVGLMMFLFGVTNVLGASLGKSPTIFVLVYWGLIVLGFMNIIRGITGLVRSSREHEDSSSSDAPLQHSDDKSKKHPVWGVSSPVKWAAIIVFGSLILIIVISIILGIE